MGIAGQLSGDDNRRGHARDVWRRPAADDSVADSALFSGRFRRNSRESRHTFSNALADPVGFAARRPAGSRLHRTVDAGRSRHRFSDVFVRSLLSLLGADDPTTGITSAGPFALGRHDDQRPADRHQGVASAVLSGGSSTSFRPDSVVRKSDPRERVSVSTVRAFALVAQTDCRLRSDFPHAGLRDDAGIVGVGR